MKHNYVRNILLSTKTIIGFAFRMIGELCRPRRLLLAEPGVFIRARSCFRGRFYNEGPTMVGLKIQRMTTEGKTQRQFKECA